METCHGNVTISNFVKIAEVITAAFLDGGYDRAA